MWGSCRRVYQQLLLVSVTSLVVMCGMTTRTSAESLTVDEVVRLALQNNPALQAQQPFPLIALQPPAVRLMQGSVNDFIIDFDQRRVESRAKRT